MKNVEDLLQHFSLSPQEAELYVLLLKQGESNVTHLATLQKKNRAAVYFHLNHLLERGLVKESRVGKRPQYSAQPPGELAAQLERWTADFKSLVPSLESLKRFEDDKPVVEIYTSSAGMKRIYDEITAQPGGSSFFVLEGKAAIKGELALLSDSEWSEFFRRIVERKILTRAVFTDESTQLPREELSKENQRLLSNRLWDLRTLPEATMPLQQLMMIYGDKAAFMIPDTKLLFTLDHPGIVGILRAMFETIHGLAKPLKGGW
ncbi:MAG: helix-turn-helix domain-containing protein [Candidatus Uhrbacteria bacterium]